MGDLFLISTKVIEKKLERQNESQHANFSFENFHKFHTTYFWECFKKKIVKMTFSFMLLFSWCASLDHHFMHYIYSFYGKADLYWKLDMNRIQTCNHTSYALEKNQRNDKQIRRASVTDVI